ncbi:hypothetical protein ACWEQL_04850 [Kitasatospora sp. NPDC004240]
MAEPPRGAAAAPAGFPAGARAVTSAAARSGVPVVVPTGGRSGVPVVVPLWRRGAGGVPAEPGVRMAHPGSLTSHQPVQLMGQFTATADQAAATAAYSALPAP